MPQTTTRYEYAPNGSLLRSVTTTESEWSPLDYAEMQALAIYEASLCPGCSRPIDICAADLVAGRVFFADTHTCPAVVAREVQQRFDQWEHADDPSTRGAKPIDAKWNDGRIYLPHPATDAELRESELREDAALAATGSFLTGRAYP